MTDEEVDEGVPAITLARLAGIIGVELLGVVVVFWGLIELYYLGGNPIKPGTAIPIGSLMITVGSVWFAKVYSGPQLMEMLRDRGDNE